MKTIGKVLSLIFVTFPLLVSCEKVDGFEEDVEPDTPSSSVTRNVKLVAKTANLTDISYPIHVYVFDKDGKIVDTATITDSDGNTSGFSLKKGQYHITALSVPADYPALASVSGTDANISMPECGYATLPLMTGSADIAVTTSNQTANVMLGYRQAGVSIAVSGVPSDVSGVSVTLSSAYTDMTLDGDMSGQTAVTVPCTKSSSSGDANVWTSGKFYIYPSTNAHPSLTITMEGGTTGTVSYSHTYNASLLSGTPYAFTARYNGAETGESGSADEDMTIYTEITTGEWADEITESFSFGGGEGSQGGAQTDVVYVSSVPSDGDIWNGHVIAAIDQDETSATTYNAVLISLEGWTDVASANNETDPTAAVAIAEDYEEGGLSGWGIPSRSDAVLLYNIYSSDANNTVLNSNIVSCGGTGVIVTNGSSNARYLCDEGKYTFSFRTSTISQAGAKTKYYLRLVKYIKFIVR